MRPIAYCTTIYKLILKIITSKLRKVINLVVDESQYAFMLDNIIHDNVIMAHELLKGYTKKHIFPRCVIQMDIQKAYDTMEWSTMEVIICEMNFPGKFIKWIIIGVSTIYYKYSIDDQNTNLLKARRGLRLGDPVSPLYLY